MLYNQYLGNKSVEGLTLNCLVSLYNIIYGVDLYILFVEWQSKNETNFVLKQRRNILNIEDKKHYEVM